MRIGEFVVAITKNYNLPDIPDLWEKLILSYFLILAQFPNTSGDLI